MEFSGNSKEMLYNETLKKTRKKYSENTGGQYGKCKNLEKPKKHKTKHKNPSNKTLEVLVSSPRGLVFVVFVFCFLVCFVFFVFQVFASFLKVFVFLLVFSRAGSHVLFQSTWDWCTDSRCSEFFRPFTNVGPMAGPSVPEGVAEGSRYRKRFGGQRVVAGGAHKLRKCLQQVFAGGRQHCQVEKVAGHIPWWMSRFAEFCSSGVSLLGWKEKSS